MVVIVRSVGPGTSVLNGVIPNIAIFKGSYLFQTIILGLHVSFREGIYIYINI